MFKRKNSKPPSVTDLPLLHYTAFRPYICSYLKSGVTVKAPSSRTAQLDEKAIESLSTDLFDELNRRQTNSSKMPKLSNFPEFSDRRNKARERLASLSEEKFRSFISEIMKQLIRRNSRIVELYDAEYGTDDYVPLPDDAPVKSTSHQRNQRRITRTPREKSVDHYPSSLAPQGLAVIPSRSSLAPKQSRFTPPSHALQISPPRHIPPTTLAASPPARNFGAPKWDEGPSSADVEKISGLEREVQVLTQDKRDLQDVAERLQGEMETLRDENYVMIEAQKSLKEQLSRLAIENEAMKQIQIDNVCI
jgi:hypothetical protein